MPRIRLILGAASTLQSIAAPIGACAVICSPVGGLIAILLRANGKQRLRYGTEVNDVVDVTLERFAAYGGILGGIAGLGFVLLWVP